MGEIAALLRRHIAALIAVIAAAAVIGYGLARAPVTYQESGLLYFHTPSSPFQSKLRTQLQFSEGEIAVVAILSILLMSPHGQQQVRSADAAARFDVAPLNLGSLEFPSYYPELTVTASGTSPARARASFAAVTQVLSNDLAGMQKQAGAPARTLLTTHFSDGPSLQAEPGSWPRMYGGLTALMVVTAVAAVILLERRRLRSAGSLSRAAQSPRPRRRLAASYYRD